jgi:transcriptional regulator with XRE-family HTH domain
MKDEETDRLTAAVVERLRQRREELGLSVNKLAEKAGMTHVGVMKLESGDRTPMLRTALKLAKALDLRLSSVLSDFDL